MYAESENPNAQPVDYHERFWKVNSGARVLVVEEGTQVFLPPLKEASDNTVRPLGDLLDGFEKYPPGIAPTPRPNARPYTRPGIEAYEIDRHDDDDE